MRRLRIRFCTITVILGKIKYFRFSGGNDNAGFIDGIGPEGLTAVLGGGGSSNTDDEASSTTRNSSTKFSRSREHSQQPPTSSLMWKERRRERNREAIMGANISDHNSSSTTSKM